ncbi:hypothetical protein JET18_14170 [Chryseobacterium sp. L7]|uniref:Glycosyltransferase RgtA/B/C/D-like domain-containing protein n=1 Tax=Chryseobacterium endalhagicum TaxID=2797638 RepID=A0ABS1QI56_9FLAO|nr:hypothetical protein [Chryseobacterium endalhagicum]MBL1221996.1 hypothetical protein [Chryseobacterium endalhagicum]
MKFIASGYLTGQPESHLVFINIIIGSVLKFFYTYFSGIEWYSLLQAALFITAFFSNLYCIIKYETQGKRFVLTLFNLSLLYFLSRFQFSYVSGFLAISAVITQLYGLTDNNKRLLALSILLMLLSSLVRFEMFFFTYPIFFMVFLFPLNKKLSFKVALIGGVLIGISFLVNQLSYKNNPDWSSYIAYNKARGSVTNNPNINIDDENIIKEFKLNIEDRTLLKNYIFTETLSEETLNKMASYGKENQVPVSQTLMSAYSNVEAYFIAIAVLLTVSLATRRFQIALAVVLHILMIYITVRYSNIVQYRILYSTLFCLLFLYVRSLNINESRTLSVSLIALTSVLLLFQIRDTSKNTYFANKKLHYIQKIESQLPEDKMYLADPTSNHYLISRKAFENPERKYIFFGWLTNFPSPIKRQSDYNSNPYKMTKYPLIISQENYDNLKPFIFNRNIYVFTNENKVILTSGKQ